MAGVAKDHVGKMDLAVAAADSGKNLLVDAMFPIKRLGPH